MRNILTSNKWTIGAFTIVGVLSFFVFRDISSRNSDETWISIVIFCILGFVSGILGLFSSAYVGVKWEQYQDTKHPENAKLELWDENKKSYTMSPLGFNVSYLVSFIVFLYALSFLEPYITKSITKMVLGD